MRNHILPALLVFSLLIGSIPSLQAQESKNSIFDIGLETQFYPTGIIPGLRLATGFGERNAVHLRVGLQFIDHRDLGVHDDETGNGWGFTVGYRRYFEDAYRGWFLGLRNDIWFNDIDWTDGEGANQQSGFTEIVVVQPTAEGGYLFVPGDGNFTVAPSIGFGYEVNVQTEGEPTGEGAILLLGVTLGFRIQ